MRGGSTCSTLKELNSSKLLEMLAKKKLNQLSSNDETAWIMITPNSLNLKCLVAATCKFQCESMDPIKKVDVSCKTKEYEENKSVKLSSNASINSKFEISGIIRLNVSDEQE